MYSYRINTPNIARFHTTPIRSQRKDKENCYQPTQLMQVQSPSTSYSPFKLRQAKPQPIQTNRIYCNQLPPRMPTTNYFKQPITKPDILDDTINKLDFLESKIAKIMEKNSALRQHLQNTDNDLTTESFSYYLSQPNKSIRAFRTSQESQNKHTFQTNSNLSPDQSVLSHRNRSTSKTPSIGKFTKSTSQSRISCNTINGRGKKVYENNFVYEGGWINSKREGTGTLVNECGQIIYQGQWKNDQFNGRGRFVNQDWMDEYLDVDNFKEFKLVQHQFKTYEGEFKDGQFNGQGTMQFQGDEQSYKYFGQFLMDQFHGVGQVTQNDDVILNGKWIHGGFV